MTRFLIILFCLVLGMTGTAQQRWATVELDGGQKITGLVVEMDLETLQIQVGEKITTIPAVRIRKCRFEERADAEPKLGGGGRTAASQEPLGPSGASRTGPLADPGDPEATPHDLRGRSLLRSRLHVLEEAYPWLMPTAPTQWLSLALLLSLSMGLVIHLSTCVYGGEGVGFRRGLLLAIWYELTIVVQMTFVRPGDMSTVLMLLANPALALFWLSTLFGLKRGPAVMAFAIQLGFVLLGFGALELVTSVVGSVRGRIS